MSDISTERLADLAVRVSHPDIIRRMILFCDKPTLSQLSLVSQRLDWEVIPCLFKHVTLDFRNCPNILPTPPEVDQNELPATLVRNDGIGISARLTNAFSYARVLEIRDHHGENPCPARLFSEGLPTAMIQALGGVHTTRFFRPYKSWSLHAGSPWADGGFCKERYGVPCRLLSLLRHRNMISPQSTLHDHVVRDDQYPPDATPRTLLGICNDMTITSKAQIIVLGKSNPKQDLRRMIAPRPVLRAPLTVVVVDNRLPHTSKHDAQRARFIFSKSLPLILDRMGMCIRFACDEKSIKSVLEQREIFESELFSFPLFIKDAEFRRFGKRIEVVPLADIMDENWVEAFKGEHPNNWV